MTDREPEPEEEPTEGRSLLDRLRGTGVGVEDENIVGDVGPTDVPPGKDPDTIDTPTEESGPESG